MSNYQQHPRQYNSPTNQQQRNRGFQAQNQSRESRDDFFETSPYEYENDYDAYGAQQRGSWRETQNARDDERYRREAHWRQGDERDRSSGAYGLDVAPRNRQAQYRPATQQNYPENPALDWDPTHYQNRSDDFQNGRNQRPVYENANYIDRARGYRGSRDDSNYRYGADNSGQSYPDVDYAPTSRAQSFNRSSNNRQWGDASPDSAASRSPYSGSNYRQPLGANVGWQNNPAYHAEDFTGGGWVSYSDSEQNYRGRAPKGYERSDERVREDICERLAHDRYIDASDITVAVKAGVVTLEGTINDRRLKHRVEDIADSCSGVKDVNNRLNVLRQASDFSTSGVAESRQNAGQTKQQTSGTPSEQNATRQ